MLLNKCRVPSSIRQSVGDCGVRLLVAGMLSATGRFASGVGAMLAGQWCECFCLFVRPKAYPLEY